MKKVILRLFLSLSSLCILAGIGGISILIYFSFDLPKISNLSDYSPPIPSRILSKDGTVLAEIGLENRSVAKFEEIPKRIIDAFLSAEDDSFYEHTGVDYMGVLRALVANIKAGRVVQGGSTITQQVAKSLLLSRERSIARKVKDFLLAQKIEERFSKEEILFLYLNQVYLGGGYYGVKSAFRGYFEKSLEEATIAEAAQVAGLLVAPGKYSPYVNPKKAKSRQRYVLKRMKATGKISEEEFKTAIDEKIKFRLRRSNKFKAGYFTDWVRQRVISLLGKEDFLREGYTVHTTIDYELQKLAEKKVYKTSKDIDKRQGYKGPLDKIEISEIESWRKKYLSDFYRNLSTYFTLNDDLKKVYELDFEEAENTSIREHRENFRKKIKNKRFIAGNKKDSKFSKYLSTGDLVKGVILYVDDMARAIYVDVGGLVGIIPYEGFSWAHERKIRVERTFFPKVTKPSLVFTAGEVVSVKINKLVTNIKGLVTGNFNKYIKNKYKKDKSLIYKQRYLSLTLEQEPEVQGALVSLNPSNGQIITLVGGNDFSKSQYNRAIQSKRQPGSAFKPLLFAAALENGFTPSKIIMDSPETLGSVDESLNWKPQNYDGKFKGPITFRNSLEQSRNIPTLKIAKELGVRKIHNFVERIGFKANLDNDLSLSLGSFGVTLMDIVTTYAIFPNGGRKLKPQSIIKITDRNGLKVSFNEKFDNLKSEEPSDAEDFEETPKDIDLVSVNEEKAITKEMNNKYLLSLGGDKVYDSRLSFIMTNLLKGIIQNGTGRGARRISQFIGGKTGTTNNYVDAWFIGFSQNLVTGVWSGFDENQSLGWGETGAKAALPTWRDFMQAGIKKYGESDFRMPSGIVNVLINKETGRIVNAGSDKGFLESFVEGTEPILEGVVDRSDQDLGLSGQILEEDDYYIDQ